MLGRSNTWSRVCGTGTSWRSDIITKQINGRLLWLYGRLAGRRDTLGCRALDLRLFLYNRKRLVGQFYSAPRNKPGTYLIVIEGRRIGHTPVHNPPLGLVLGANEILNFPVPIAISDKSSSNRPDHSRFGRNMTRRKLRLPIPATVSKRNHRTQPVGKQTCLLSHCPISVRSEVVHRSRSRDPPI